MNEIIEKKDQTNDDVLWLSCKMQDASQVEMRFFCNMVKNTLLHGWMLLDARNYALGRLIGQQSFLKTFAIRERRHWR